MKKKKAIIAAVLAAVALFAAGTVFLIFGNGETPMNRLQQLLPFGTYTVGTSIAHEEITEFYYTVDASTNPPYFQRYRFYREGDAWFFYHEKREGDHWPLTEADATVTGTKALSAEETQAFFDCIDGGAVTGRKENLESGGRGPWLYLYWRKDRGKYQVFEFSSWEKEGAFEALCETLTEGAKG